MTRLSAHGWVIEGDAAFGFAFVHRNGERRLLMLTERDPADIARQSFSPYS
jgi:hypothetical protein